MADLGTLIDIYANPLVRSGIVSEADGHALFANIETLRDLNQALLHDLAAAISEAVAGHAGETAGEVLGRYAPFFKLYTLYVSNYHANVHDTLERLKAVTNAANTAGAGATTAAVAVASASVPASATASAGASVTAAAPGPTQHDPMANIDVDGGGLPAEDFATFCHRIQTTEPRCRGLSLSSFLIMPIQRIPRYVLLLRELLKQVEKLRLLGDGSAAKNKKKRQKGKAAGQGLKKTASFGAGLEREISAIRSALSAFEFVAKSIDQDIVRVRATMLRAYDVNQEHECMHALTRIFFPIHPLFPYRTRIPMPS